MTDHDFVEAWITDLDGTLVGYLERSPTSLIRHVAFSIELNKPGAASFEYHRSSASVIATPGLVALDNLLWIKYRGITRAYVLEERTMQLDEQEEATGWFRLAGRGVLQLLGDRIIWPDGFDGTNQPDAWTDQWHTVAGVHAGTMLADLISDSASRFAAPVAAGTIETQTGDEWTQQFRFDTLLDVVDAVTATWGDVDMDGLTFNYYNQLGADLSGSIILEEGSDVMRATRQTTKHDAVSWVVAEGVGEGVFAKVATANDGTATRRREAYLEAKDAGNLGLLGKRAEAALDENKGATDSVAVDILEAPEGGRWRALTDFGVGDWVKVMAADAGVNESLRVVALYFAETDDERVRASMDVNDRRTEYLIRLQEGNQSTAHSLGVKNRMPQGQLVPYSLGPWTGPFDSDVAAQFFFTFPSRIFLLLDVVLKIRLRQFQSTSRNAAGATSGPSSTSTTASGGSSTPTSSSGGSQTPTSGSSSASTTDAGGSSSPTSGASSASTTGGGAHQHVWASYAGAAGGYTTRHFQDGPGAVNFDLATDIASGLATADDFPVHDHGMAHTHTVTIAAHDHGMAHTHTVTIAAHTHTVTIAAHTHGMDHTHTVPALDLNYGMFEETLPASWSVTPKLYSVDSGGSLTLVHTFTAITDKVHELDLTAYAETAGDWMVELQSDAAQPNNGRLVADVYGAATGAISSAR